LTFFRLRFLFYFVVPLCGLFHTVVEDPWPKLIPHPHKAEENYPIRCPVNVRIILKQRTGNWLHDFNEFNVGLNVSWISRSIINCCSMLAMSSCSMLGGEVGGLGRAGAQTEKTSKYL
jgi:hypothetical protein